MYALHSKANNYLEHKVFTYSSSHLVPCRTHDLQSLDYIHINQQIMVPFLEFQKIQVQNDTDFNDIL